METWEITRTQYRVSDFLSWQRAKSLVLSPSFQRNPVWRPGAKSFLIDTVVRGLPMPIIFLREQKTDLNSLEPKREVVDGQQRLRTLISYIEPKCLPDFKEEHDAFAVQKNHNPEIAGKTFSDLSPEIKRRLLDYQFSVHVLPSHVGDRDVVQLFARMNATGVKLNDQEIRNAKFYGELKTCVYELGSEQLQRWREWQIFSEYDIARMQEVEMVSEFAMLDIKGVTGKSQKALDSLYEDKDVKYAERKLFEKKFRATMDTIQDKLGKLLPVSPFRKKAVFYNLFAALYGLQHGLPDRSVSKNPSALSATIVEWLKKASDRLENGTAPENVLEAIARRTTHPSSRRDVIKYLTKTV